MTDDLTARTHAALEDTTPEPWQINGLGNVNRSPGGEHPPVAKAWKPANATFIAAQSPVPELLARVEQLRDEIIDRDEHIDNQGHALRQVRQALEARRAEVARLRSYKSLPPGRVWQDYYSPDDVLKIRESLDAEVERLTALQAADQVTARAAITERDQGLAAIARVRELHRRVNSVTCENCGEDTDCCVCDCTVEVWMPVCDECSPDSDGHPVAHPCATIRALDGES